MELRDDDGMIFFYCLFYAGIYDVARDETGEIIAVQVCVCCMCRNGPKALCHRCATCPRVMYE